MDLGERIGINERVRKRGYLPWEDHRAKFFTSMSSSVKNVSGKPSAIRHLGPVLQPQTHIRQVVSKRVKIYIFEILLYFPFLPAILRAIALLGVVVNT